MVVIIPGTDDGKCCEQKVDTSEDFPEEGGWVLEKDV